METQGNDRSPGKYYVLASDSAKQRWEKGHCSAVGCDVAEVSAQSNGLYKVSSRE